MKKIITALLLGISTFSFSQEFIVVGYVPTYRWEILDQLDFSQINYVMASFVNPDAQGNLQFEKDIDEFSSKVHAGGAKALVSMCGGGNYSWGDDHLIYKNLIETAEKRTSFVHKIMDYLRIHNLDGIDNDMEGMALKLANYNIFTQELADSVHAAGLAIDAAYYVGGMWGDNLVTDSTLMKLDHVFTMSYGGVGNWNWSQKDDGGSYGKFKADVDHLIKRGVPKHKVVGGVPFYTVEFPSSAQQDYNKYHKTICEVLNDPFYKELTDTVTTKDGNTMYVNTIPTLYKKIDYAHQAGGGIMIWEVGQDCFDDTTSVMKLMWKYMEEKNIRKSGTK